MVRLQIAFFEVDPWQAEYLEQGIEKLGIASQLKADFLTHQLSVEDCERCANYDAVAVFIGTKVSSTVLQALPNLNLILTMSQAMTTLTSTPAANGGSRYVMCPTMARTPSPSIPSR